jgi:acyl-CoA synthetase (AMP-forming)/AMP-acid ligase II
VQPHFGAIWEAISDATPDAPAVVQGARKVDWRNYEQRAARLARALLDAGLGPHSKVGMYLYNSPEYCEANFAAIKIRGVPINVNYRYLDRELAYLLENADVEALVFHSSLADRVARVRPGLPKLRPARGGRRRPRRGRLSARRRRGALRGDPALVCTGRSHRAAGRRDLHALHGRNDGHAQGRDVRDERLHELLPKDLSTDGRHAEARRSRRASGARARAARERGGTRLDVRTRR